jgi:hypothetical protein
VGQEGDYCPLNSDYCGKGYFCDADSKCRKRRGVNEFCLLNDNYCKEGLVCNGLSKCEDPTDPCRCSNSGRHGTLCADWDASGYKWCYVEDPKKCKVDNKKTFKSSNGTDVYRKGCKI